MFFIGIRISPRSDKDMFDVLERVLRRVLPRSGVDDQWDSSSRDAISPAETTNASPMKGKHLRRPSKHRSEVKVSSPLFRSKCNEKDQEYRTKQRREAMSKTTSPASNGALKPLENEIDIISAAMNRPATSATRQSLLVNLPLSQSLTNL